MLGKKQENTSVNPYLSQNASARKQSNDGTEYIKILLQSAFRTNKLNIIIFENNQPIEQCATNYNFFQKSLPDHALNTWHSIRNQVLATGDSFKEILGGYIISGFPIGKAYLIAIDGTHDYHHENQILQDSIKSLHLKTQLFYDFFDSLPEPLWIRDQFLNVIFVNQKFLSMLEATDIKQVTEQNSWVCDKVKSDALARLAFEKFDEQKIDISFVDHQNVTYGTLIETPIILQNGDIRIFGRIIKNSKELELKNQINYLSQGIDNIFSNISVAVSVFDTSRRLRFYNQAFVDLWKLSPDYLETAPDHLDLLDQLKAQRLIPEMRDPTSWQHELMEPYSNLNANYDEIWYTPQQKTIKCTISAYPQGGVICIQDDVTDYVALEKSNQTLTNNITNTLNSLSEVVILTDYSGCIKVANTQANDVFGFTISVDDHLSVLIDSYDTDVALVRFVQKIYNLIQNGFPSNGIFEQQLSIGNLIFSASARRLVSTDILICLKNDTAALQYQKSLTDKADLLKENAQIRESFFRRISHNLRDPITTIAGFTEIMQMEIFGSLNEKQKEYLDHILYATNTILRLTENLADLVRLQDASSLFLEKLSLKEIIASAIEAVSYDAIEQKITLNRDIEGDAYVQADSAMLRQMFIQILENAITATPREKSIDISFIKTKHSICVAILDQGKGLDTQLIEAIHARKINNIRGYGLRYALRVASLHDINFEVITPPTGGTLFKIILFLDPTSQ